VEFQTVGIVGAGTMGAGIAQVAAQAGSSVFLFDARGGAAQSAIDRIRSTFSTLASKGRMTQDAAVESSARLAVAPDLQCLSPCDLIIEAIVEDLTAKRTLLRTLEGICGPDSLLASNTSSLSITAIAAALERPERVLGLHFFNPPPLMPLVEVIHGRLTASDVVARAEVAMRAWGKTPIRCASTPGFIVNRVARPFYGEALRVLEAGGADVATVDLILREAGGFRMGAFELMDLIGLDVNLAVSKSVWSAYYFDSRYRPSWTQEEMVAAGLLGRKTGRGFYTYPGAVASVPSSPLGPAPSQVQYLTESDALNPLVERIRAAGIKVQSRKEEDPFGAGMLRIGSATVALTDGRTANQIAVDEELTQVVALDLARDFATTRRVALARGEDTTTSALADAVGLFRALGIEVSVIDDLPGLIVARTIAMLANEAADAVMQRVATADAVDQAIKLGLNHPEGPLETADRIGLTLIDAILTHLQAQTGDDRYRSSLLLQRAIWSGRDLR